MTAAIVALAIALVAAVAGLISFGAAALSARKDAGSAEKRGAVLDANNTMLAQKLADIAEQLKHAQEANDDLEALLDDWAADQPIDGSFERLLAQRKARRGDGSRVVHTDESAERGNADRLLRPGEDP